MSITGDYAASGADPHGSQAGRLLGADSPATPPSPSRALGPQSGAGRVAGSAEGASSVPWHAVRRGLASLLDWTLTFLLALVIWGGAVIGPDESATGSSGWHLAALAGIVVGIMFVYGAALEAIRGATLGKLVTGIRARAVDGGRCTISAALRRNVSKAAVGAATSFLTFAVYALHEWLASRGSLVVWTPQWSRLAPMMLLGPAGLLLTFVIMRASPLRQRLGDRLAGTVVIRRRVASRELAGRAADDGEHR